MRAIERVGVHCHFTHNLTCLVNFDVVCLFMELTIPSCSFIGSGIASSKGIHRAKATVRLTSSLRYNTP
jgi:hypothetical protein